jgi:hypothetical protein
MKLTLQNADKVNRNLLSLARRMPKIAATALNNVADQTLTESIELTPVDSGDLRRSAKVLPYAKPTNLVATLTYGEDYALAVHEIPPPPRKSKGGRSARHFPPFGKGGQWKYLETAVKQRSRTFLNDIAREMKNAIKRSIR